MYAQVFVSLSHTNIQTNDSFGCLLELTWNGQKPLALVDAATDEKATRTFLEDGEELSLQGYAEGRTREGVPYRVGFGTATGRIMPAFETSNTTSHF